MLEVVKLHCPSCAGTLEVGKHLEQFACGHCGTTVVVRRGGGVISLAPVVEGLTRVERGVDRTASELAIKRLEGDIVGLLAVERQHREAASRAENGVFVAAVLALGGLILATMATGMVVPGVALVLIGLIFGALMLNSRKMELAAAMRKVEERRELENETARHRSIVRV